jgi:hypothetical protein
LKQRTNRSVINQQEGVIMGSELMLGGFGQADNGKSVMSRPSKTQRAMQRREEQEAAQLMYEARKQEATEFLRKRMTETALHDTQDIGELASELAKDDAFLASLLAPIAQEFGRQAARDVRLFGNGL